MPRQDSTVAADGTAPPTGPGPDALRRALRGPPGRVALRLPAPALPAQRRVIVALMEEAARPRGAAVLETAQGELLLTDAEPADGARLAALLVRLLGTEPERLALPEAVAPLLALPGLAPAGTAITAPPAATGIEAMTAALPLAALLRRHGVLHLAAGQPRRLAFLQLVLPDAALAPHLGAAAADPDLLRHAGDRLRGRLLTELAEPARRDALLGAIPAVPLLIDLPYALLPSLPPAAAAAGEDGVPLPALVATLSAAEAMTEGLARRRAALRHAGWGLAVRGLDAASLALLAPEALPVDLLLLHWSPDLAGRAAVAGLRRVDAARLILTGCDGAAIEWGMAMGVARFAGPAIDALLAAQRMAACDHAGTCTRSACATRGQAAAPAGRAGCFALPLLSALLPREGAA
ncbi:hypothetical protein GXW78_11270 [Roseomonas terrae]|jgi:hypothetical protein|uniref:Uncharacterized protein n=1 Tax=Neoroseomonas terrae TaxID=424799 RepID=A0ABS5EGT7_9PROT|nr:hypothetical protein [Neoroseomonas terrae]MBR0650244.1 hypothetical protein [Neoroseomonas terrae]